jgi:polyisoprenoid-binding protein YceI
VEIPVASVDTSVAQRDEHLRSADFLDAEQHPVIAFRSRSVRGRFVEPGDRFEVVGDLTIRGTTREVVLEAVYDGRGADLWGG